MTLKISDQAFRDEYNDVRLAMAITEIKMISEVVGILNRLSPMVIIEIAACRKTTKNKAKPTSLCLR